MLARWRVWGPDRGGPGLRSPQGSQGQPWAPPHCPCPEARESASGTARPGEVGLQWQREEGSCLFFLQFRVAGRGAGAGTEELTLLVLTLAQASREPPGEGGPQGQAAGGCGAGASPPHSWGSRPKPIPQASPWSGMLGFPRSGRNWQRSLHDVTGPAPAWPRPRPQPLLLRERGMLGSAQGLRCLSRSGPGHPAPPCPDPGQPRSPSGTATSLPTSGHRGGIEGMFPEPREHPSNMQ